MKETLDERLKRILNETDFAYCPECHDSYPNHQISEHGGICGNCALAIEKAKKSESEKLSQEVKPKRKRNYKEKYRIDTGTGNK